MLIRFGCVVIRKTIFHVYRQYYIPVTRLFKGMDEAAVELVTFIEWSPYFPDFNPSRLHCLEEKYTVNVEKPETAVAVPGVSTTRKWQSAASRFTSKHPISHLPIERTGSTYNSRRRSLTQH
jgi:hypothetical protein